MNYYEGKLFRTTDGKLYTNDLDGEGFTEIAPTVESDCKVYVATMTQSSTNAPAVTVLKNDIGSIVWTRYITNGVYRGTLAGAFPAGKTAVFVNTYSALGITVVRAYRGGDDYIQINTYVESEGVLTLFDGMMNPLSIRIEVYP